MFAGDECTEFVEQHPTAPVLIAGAEISAHVGVRHLDSSSQEAFLEVLEVQTSVCAVHALLE